MVRPSSPPSSSSSPSPSPPHPSSPHLKPLKTSLKWSAPTTVDRPSSALSPLHHRLHHHHHHACDPSSAMEDPLQSGLQKLIKSGGGPGGYNFQGRGNGTTDHGNCILLQPNGDAEENGNLPRWTCEFLKEDATLMQGCDSCFHGSGKLEENHGEGQEINGEASQEGHGKVDQESHGKIHQKQDLHEKASDEDQHLHQDVKLYSTSNLIMNDGTADQMNLMQIPQKVGNSFSMCGRQRLQRHWMETGGNVCIPEIWGREQHLEEWVSYGIVEDALRPAGLMAARAALINTDVRRRKSSSASSSTSSSPNNRSSSSSRRPLIIADVGVS